MTIELEAPHKVTHLERVARDIMIAYPTKLAATRQGLLDCEIPPQRCINAFFEAIRVNRFPCSDDVWEMIEALEGGYRYTKPPKHLIDKWRLY